MQVRSLAQVAAPRSHASSTPASREIEGNIKFLEAQRELVRMTGRSSDTLDERIKKARELLKQAEKPPLTFSDHTRQQVHDYLKGQAGLPDTLDADQNKSLEVFARLVHRGMHFCQGQVSTEPIPPDHAFLQLISSPYQASDDQVKFLCRTPRFTKSVTLRASYLPAVDLFLDKTLEGEVFYYKPEQGRRSAFESAPNAEGYVKITDAADFIAHCHQDYKNALVRSDGHYIPLAERTRRKHEMEQFIAEATSAPEQSLVQELGDTVLVGGIALDKQEADW